MPEHGRLLIHDTNYASSEGTSRLAVRGRDGVRIEGDTLPEDVDQIAIRPVWQLGDDEERRTRQTELPSERRVSAPPARSRAARFVPSERGCASGDVTPGSPARAVRRCRRSLAGPVSSHASWTAGPESHGSVWSSWPRDWGPFTPSSRDTARPLCRQSHCNPGRAGTSRHSWDWSPRWLIPAACW